MKYQLYLILTALLKHSFLFLEVDDVSERIIFHFDGGVFTSRPVDIDLSLIRVSDFVNEIGNSNG